MNKDNYVYNNELTNLQDEFKNLQITETTETNQKTETNNLSQPTTNQGLNVSVDTGNSVQELINKLIIYVQEKKPSLAILTPCYGGLCYSNYTTSLINTIKIFESCNFPIKPYFLNNDSLVSRARNNLIGTAMLDQSITHFIFIDGDIVWNPIDIVKLVLSDELIIGGLYPKKNYKFNKIISDPQVITQWIEKKNKIDPNISDEQIIRNNLLDYNLNYLSSNLQINKNKIEIKHLATGFMMFKREVIEMMFQKFPETKYIDDTGFIPHSQSIYTYALFDCGVINGSYYSEDWLFCHRWIGIGGKIYADISIDLDHIGTENYHGSFIKNLLTTKY
jgi:hypothetical protein